jgi:uracil-DNA glycosylase
MERSQSSRIDEFVQRLGHIPPPPNAFNPWDAVTEAGAACRHNLSLYLTDLAARRTGIMLLGEAPGYQGCRRTGIPFTSEYILLNGVDALNVLGESRGYRRAPSEERISKEPSGTIVWSTLAANDFVPLLWPAYPFHPHKPGIDRSNRPPTRAEIELGRPLWLELGEIMQIETYVAIGNVAHASLAVAGIDALKIRHPSQGGKPQFVAGIEALAASLRR